METLQLEAQSMEELEQRLCSMLATYSNIHRGSGYNSQVTTSLFEQARINILNITGLSPKKHMVVFCSPRRARLLVEGIDPAKYRILSSEDLNLALGVRAVVLEKRIVPPKLNLFSGGGTARLVGPGWVVWAKGPGRYEPGTPAIINILAFAMALSFMTGSLVPAAGKNSRSFSANDPVKSPPHDLNGDKLLAHLRETLIGYDLMVPSSTGMRKYINLDNAASTRTFLPVWDSFRRAMKATSQERIQIIRNTRKLVADFTGAPLSGNDIIFTSNSTEALSLVAESISNEYPSGTCVVNTPVEHNSNELPWRSFRNIRLIKTVADRHGIIDISHLEKLLEKHNNGSLPGERISLVTISGASNVTGTYNDLEAISRLVHSYGARLLVDAAQLIGHRAIAVKDLTIDYLVFSGHKMYAPFGTGVLIAGKGLLCFDEKEMNEINFSGEENTAGIAALGEAVLCLSGVGMDIIQKEEQELTAYALRELSKVDKIEIYGISDPGSVLFAKRGGVISFLMKNMIAFKVGASLSARGIGVRTGCHCAHIFVKYLLDIPPFLEKFQRVLLKVFPKLSLPGIVRISIGVENTREDIDALVKELHTIAAA